MPGQLFTHYFLTAGIKATAEWQSAAAAHDRVPQRNRPGVSCPSPTTTPSSLIASQGR